MRKLILVVVALTVLGFAPMARAASITFDLNCTLTNAGCTAVGTDYGSITLTDNGKNISVTVSGNGVWKYVDSFYLNYGGTKEWGWDFDLDFGMATYSSNDQKVGVGRLDIKLDPNYTFAPLPWTGTLKLHRFMNSDYDLDVSMFNLTDAKGIYAAATLWDSAGLCNQNKVNAGSVPETPVPEPASMLLLGTGLVGLAGAAKRRLRK